MASPTSVLFPSVQVLGVCILLLIVLLGCTGTQGDQASLTQLQGLQDKYYVRENFSSSQAKMNDYISALAALRSKSSGSAAKIIDAEEYSAQAFYYLSKALSASTKINYLSVHCNSKEVQDTIGAAQLSIESSTKAIAAIQALNTTERDKLRPGQLDATKGYLDNATQMKQFFDDKC